MKLRPGPAAAAVLLVLAAAGPVVGGRAATTGDAAAGAQVFNRTACGACHTLGAAQATGRVGPNLDQTKPDAARVRTIVTSGRGGMPAFGSRLTDVQIADLAAFIAQATGAAPPSPAPPAPAPPAPTGPAPAPDAPGLPGADVGRDGAQATRILLALGAGGVRIVPKQLGAGPVRMVITNSDDRARRLEVRRVPAPGIFQVDDPWLLRVGRRVGVRIGPRARRGWSLTLTPGRYLVRAAPAPFRRAAVATLNVTPPPPRPPTPASPAPPAPSPPPAPAAGPPPVVAPAGPPDGRLLFTGICGACHTFAAAGTLGTVGPNLDRERPDYDDVVETVLEGDDEMPSFAGTLNREQIQAIAAFVAASTRRR